MKIVNIAERMAEEIRNGALPADAALAACKAAGKLETKEWLRTALPVGSWPATRWNLTQLARRVQEHLLSRPGAWEAIEVRYVRVGDFVVTDEDALAAVTGRDRDGQPVEALEVSWEWQVMFNGLRVDELARHGGYVDLIQHKTCACCKRRFEDEAQSETIYDATTVLRLRYVGNHRVASPSRSGGGPGTSWH